MLYYNDITVVQITRPKGVDPKMPPLREKPVTNQRLKPINPVVCGYHSCDKSHPFGPATRHFWLLHFVVSGYGSFQTARGTYKVGPGDVFIIRPYDITYYVSDKDDPWTYLWIGFTSDIPLPHPIVSADMIHAPYLQKLFTNAFETNLFEKTNPMAGAYEHYLCGILWQIFGLLMRDNVSTKSAAENYVRAAISIIEAEYSTDLNVSSIAERLHLNRSYFSEIFRQITGISPHKYLTDYRMRCAEELLTTHKCNVTVTAHSVGYPDVFAFSRAYKHHFGHAPTQPPPENAAQQKVKDELPFKIETE